MNLLYYNYDFLTGIDKIKTINKKLVIELP